MIYFTIYDIQDYLYCPRTVFFTYLQPVRRKINTTKRLRSSNLLEQSDLEGLDSNRRLKKYGLKEGERLFHLGLTSSKLRLSGEIDLVIKSKEGIFPVKLEYTNILSNATPTPQNISQKALTHYPYSLSAYALLLEEYYGIIVNEGFIYSILPPKLQLFHLTKELKNQILEIIAQVWEMIRKEKMPHQPKSTDRCNDCEYQNFCGDIW